MHRPVGLAFVKRTATTDLYQLRRLGYRQIGRGSFSRAFVHPDAPDIVVKVGTSKSHRSHLSHLRDAFPDFARRILLKQISSKFYPKIYDVRTTPYNHLVIMRRYYPNKDRGITRTIDQTASVVSSHTKYRPPKTDLRRFGRALKALTGAHILLDIHSKNIMRDLNGTPILIDPICHRR